MAPTELGQGNDTYSGIEEVYQLLDEAPALKGWMGYGAAVVDCGERGAVVRSRGIEGALAGLRKTYTGIPDHNTLRFTVSNFASGVQAA